MWNTVKVFRQVRIDDVGVASADEPVHFLDSIGRIPTGPITIGTAFQVCLKDWFQHQLGRGLNHSIPNRRNSEWPLAAPRLGDYHPSHWGWLVRLREQFLAQARKPLLDARRFDTREILPVDAGRTRVRAGKHVGVPENVFSAYLVVEQVEAVVGLRLRLTIELSLKGPDLFGCFQAHRQRSSDRD